MTEPEAEPRCSFCGKLQRMVKGLVAGPSVYICNECVDLCVEILNEIEGEELEEPGRWAVQHARIEFGSPSVVVGRRSASD